MNKNINIVLVEPEIPQNTGNIARTCAAIGATLHLVGPLGFSVDDKYLKRAGLDYWDMVDVQMYASWDEFMGRDLDGQYVYVTTKAGKTYSEIQYAPPVYLFFGRESAGLPESLLRDNHDRCVRIPMIDDARSLNLSNAVAIVTYEALRQHGYSGLRKKGTMPGALS